MAREDEHYIIDLIDDYLGIEAERKKKFDFLQGDSSINRKGRNLDIHGYYPSLHLAVQYLKRHNSKPVKLFDNKMTVSRTPRGQQRGTYVQKRLEILLQHGIYLMILDYGEFDLAVNGRDLLKDYSDRDKEVIKRRFRYFRRWK